jgi:hypothetical protein
MATEKKQTEVTKVTMNDGREVEFTGKTRLSKSATIGDDGTIKVKLDWRNGECRTFTMRPDMVTKFPAGSRTSTTRSR